MASENTPPSQWWVYILECADGTLYTGVAIDVQRRIAVHNAGRGARYTRGRLPVAIVDYCGPMNHGDALRLEIAIKRLAREHKLDYLRAAKLANALAYSSRNVLTNA